MARPKKLKPDICQDKSTNRAFVTLNGKRKYLGKWNTPESRDQYDRIVGEWITAGRRIEEEVQGITIEVLLEAFMKHAMKYFAGIKTGTQLVFPCRRKLAASPFLLPSCVPVSVAGD